MKLGRITGYEISQDQIFGEGYSANMDRKITFDDIVLALCCTADLNVWNKIQESGKRTETFNKSILGQQKPSLNFCKVDFSSK